MKNLTLKVAVVALAMFAGFGANAQTPWTVDATHLTLGDYTRSDTSVAVYDKVTVGKSMPFWVYPSVAYNPSYVVPATGLYTPVTEIAPVATVLSTFAWSSYTDLTEATAAANYTAAGAVRNYVEASWSTVGTRVLKVVETPAGGVVCAGKAIRFQVNVIDAPASSITNTAVVAGNYGLTLSNVIGSACGVVNTAINVAQTTAAEVAPFNYNVGYKVYTVAKLNGSGQINNAAGVLSVGGDVVDYTASSTVQIFGDDATTNPSATNPIVTSDNTLVPAMDFTVQDSKITVYELTYNNVNGTISRKSDYLARRAGTLTGTYGFSYYPTVPVAAKRYIIVLPKPVTGPIYHIANTFAY